MIECVRLLSGTKLRKNKLSVMCSTPIKHILPQLSAKPKDKSLQGSMLNCGRIYMTKVKLSPSTSNFVSIFN